MDPIDYYWDELALCELHLDDLRRELGVDVSLDTDRKKELSQILTAIRWHCGELFAVQDCPLQILVSFGSGVTAAIARAIAILCVRALSVPVEIYDQLVNESAARIASQKYSPELATPA